MKAVCVAMGWSTLLAQSGGRKPALREGEGEGVGVCVCGGGGVCVAM